MQLPKVFFKKLANVRAVNAQQKSGFLTVANALYHICR